MQELKIIFGGIMDFNKAKEYLTTLLKIKSVESESKEGMPFGEGVEHCLSYALDILKDEGFKIKNGKGYYGYGDIGEGDEIFGILCHLDVVPEGKGWTYPPFGAEEHDNKIYARGALDDKAPFIASLYAIKKLVDENHKFSKKIRIILGCDEESGWKCMDEYVKNEKMPDIGFSPDGDFPVINCEKGIVYHSIRYPKPEYIYYIKSGERANMVPDYAEAKVILTPEIYDILQKFDKKIYEIDYSDEYALIKTYGKSAHGSHPENGENALIKLINLLGKYDKVFKELSVFSESDGNLIGLNIEDEKSGKLTLNLGTALTENGEMIFELDVRHPVSFGKEYVTEKLKEKLSGKVEETFYHLPLYVDKKHPLVKTLLSAYNKVTGENAEPISIGGGTYARVLPLGVAFGPCFPNSKAGIHCADEYVDLDEFKKMADIYYYALKELCTEIGD